MGESSMVVLPACDVVVVGAGISGLAAAFALQQEGKRVEMFEQEAEVGGRIATDPTRPGIDYGAAYFGPLQSYTMRFAELLQLDRLSNDLDSTFYHRTEWWNGQLLKFDKRSFAVPPGASGELLKSFGWLGGFFDPSQMLQQQVGEVNSNEDALFSAIAELETLVLQLRCHLDSPWDFPKAKAFDGLSVEDWIGSQYKNSHVQDLLRVGVRSALSTETSEISMLYLLYYCATGGSFVNVMAVGGGADSYRFKDGASAMVSELRKAITKDKTIRNKLLIANAHDPVELRTSMLVTQLKNRAAGDGVTVTARSATGGSYTIDAKHVIVAVTPTLRNKLTIDGSTTSFPPTAMGMGQTLKTFATFDRPWWKEERGASGYALSARNTPDSPVVWTMDNSWHDAEDRKQHCLMGFIVGARARELAAKTKAERKQIVLAHWSRIFETPLQTIEAACTDFSDRDWSTGVSGGCPAAFFKPGQFHLHGLALRRANGRIHWSGAETATDWVGGYINGALQAGLRAALET